MRRIRLVWVLPGVAALWMLCAGLTLSAPAGGVVFFEATYQRTGARPVTSTDTFRVPHPGEGYTLHLLNGPNGHSRVTSAVVILNGRQIWGPSDFNTNVAHLDREVLLKEWNTIEVELRGAPGSGFAITIGGNIGDEDTVRPVISSTVNPLPNPNGWNNSNVLVSFVCSDAQSGIASCSGPVTLSVNGANQTVTGTAVDEAGNTATTTVAVNLDKSLPGIVATRAPSANSNGWNNTDVTVSFVCSDALSGIASCSGPATVSVNGANQAITGTAVDKAGNTTTTTVTVNLDGSSPAIVATSSPAASGDGWNNTDVTVSFVCSDAVSGMASCSGPATVTANGANQTVTGTGVDKAGNTTTTTVAVNLDKSLPNIVATSSPAANSDGWNSTDVTVSFACSDALSGIASCSGPATVSANGANQNVTGTAVDKAGNTTTTTVAVSLDKSSPNIVATPSPAANSDGWNKADVTVSFACDDALSGIASCPSPLTVTNDGGSQTMNGAATDKAGNTATAGATVNLDKTPPTLSMTSPSSSVSTAQLSLTGTAADGLSGLRDITCNGVSASISVDSYTCTLSLSEGANAINVQATDRAGNSTTSAVNVMLTSFVPPPPGPTAVSWINGVGVTTTDNNLTKKNGPNLWNSGAVSMQVLPDGYGFIEFTATEATTTRIAGLGSTDLNQDYADVDYGVMLRGDSSLAIYESGVLRGEFGSYAAADRFRLEVRYGVVRYLRNGVLFFTSLTPIRYPLRFDCSFLTPGATLTDVRLGNVVWTDAVGVHISGESLIKTGAAGWNAGAISTNTIESGDGYLEFTATETNTARIGGLGNLVAGIAASDIQFGVQLNSDATVEIVEGGASRGIFGAYAPGDRFRIELRIGVVRYYRNNTPLYTSLQMPSYPLRADSAFDTPGATLTNVDLEPLGWSNGPGVYTDGALLIKTNADGWTTAASSAFDLQSGDGYAEFTAIETDHRRGLGLKSSGAAQSLEQIDYLLSLTEAGTVEVIELGNSRGLFGSYRNGDRFRIEVQNGVVRYRRNGVLLYSSAVSPAYPLHAEAALYSQNATLVDVDLGDLVWTNAVNARPAGRSLIKTTSSISWEAGAVSTRTTSSGYVEFTASEASTFRIAGLSNGDSNQDFADIDFAILLRSDGSVIIYEAGILRGNFATYVAGDRFRVEVQSGVVRYRKNGTLLYTSTLHPLAPLRVDTALHGANATLFNIVFR